MAGQGEAREDMVTAQPDWRVCQYSGGLESYEPTPPNLLYSAVLFTTDRSRSRSRRCPFSSLRPAVPALHTWSPLSEPDSSPTTCREQARRLQNGRKRRQINTRTRVSRFGSSRRQWPAEETRLDS